MSVLGKVVFGHEVSALGRFVFGHEVSALGKVVSCLVMKFWL